MRQQLSTPNGTHNTNRTLGVGLLVAVLTLVLAAGARPASAAPDAPAGCFWTETSWGYHLWLPEQRGEIIIRSNSGEELAVGRHSNIPLEDLTEWRVVAIDGNSETVGDYCSEAAFDDAPVPQVSVEWLPGAQVTGVGIFGSARISWQPVGHNGVPATHYEFYRTSVKIQQYGPSAPYHLPYEGVVKTTSAGSFDWTLDAEHTDRDEGSADQLYVRAWWPDGVSQATRVLLPGQGSLDSTTTTNSDFFLEEFVSQAPQVNTSPVFMKWNTPVDHRGQAPDAYHVVLYNNHDGTRAGTERITDVFGSGTNEAVITHSSNFTGGTRLLRAVWWNGGVLGGPQTKNISLSPRPDSSSVGSVQVTDFQVSAETATSFEVSFKTDRCVYGDYRVLEMGHGGRPSVDFNAPQNGRCYTNHGITVGVHTVALKPNTPYWINLRLTDPVTGEITFRRGSVHGETTEATVPPAPVHRCFGEVATIVGTPGDDIIIGTPGHDVIRGFGGSDIIKGLGGDDLICGDSGNDILIGGSGNDRIRGGNGRDWMSGGSGKDQLNGGNHADRIHGNAGRDLIWGGGGHDWMWGGADRDLLWAGNGNDRLFGGGGTDSLRGAPTDLLNGNTGTDWCTFPNNPYRTSCEQRL